MSLLSSVTGAVSTVATGVDLVSTTLARSAGPAGGFFGGLAKARTRDPLTAKLLGAPAAKAGTAKPSAAKAGTTKASAAKAGAAKASSGAKQTTVAKKTTAASGYGQVSGDFAFLKDPTLSVEEKLFRFMCAVAKRNDDEVLKKMEEMKGGEAAAAKASSGSTAKKSKKFSVWGALKALVPPLGLAAQVVGDAKLKSLITQVSGPVLAAAATALGMPMLAPLAMKAGPALASSIVNGSVDGDTLAQVTGTAGGTASTAGGSTASAGSTTSSGSAKNEQVQMMELQRLVDKQKEMFAMISNILRAQHDTRMAIIGNVR